MIKYYKKSNYGKERIYLEDNKDAKAVQNLTGKKTVTKEDLKNLEKLGVKTRQVVNRI